MSKSTPKLTSKSRTDDYGASGQKTASFTRRMARLNAEGYQSASTCRKSSILRSDVRRGIFSVLEVATMI